MFRTTRSLLQVAALPFVHVAGAAEILLITTRKRKHWGIPKGWPAKHLSPAGSAAREAEEEAGVIGHIHPDAIGRYGYDKRTAAEYAVPCQVLVYPLRVTQQLLTLDEQRQRGRMWCPLPDAAGIVREPELARLLGELADAPDRLIASDDVDTQPDRSCVP